MSKLKDFGLYFITDSTLTKKNIIDDIKAAIKGGVKIVQYREKGLPASEMAEEAKKISQMCRKSNVIFLVDDRIDVALAADADGVHLGKEDIPYADARKILGKNRIIGLSAHSVKDALNNQRMGADYTSIGPIYHTSTKKPAKEPIGLKPIKQLKSKLKIPFVAIGGINENNIGEVLNAGARNVAMISAIAGKDNVESAVREFIKQIRNRRSNSNF